MCRYAWVKYKTHHACFACRKAFKQPSIEDWLAVRGRGFVYSELHRVCYHKDTLQRREAELGVTLIDLEAEYQRAAHVCPECGKPMVDLGLDFKPPRESDEKAWRILAGMYRVGHVFHTCGCDGPGFIPQHKPEYERYLAERRKEYQEQLKGVQNSDELLIEARHEAEIYWHDRIAKIEAELAALSQSPKV